MIRKRCFRGGAKEMARRRAGFTLVELLVVVSIIALLIAILLPSLKKARAQTKSVVCKANLRSMGQAFSLYAEYYGGVWPPATDVYNANRWPVPFHLGGIIKAQLARIDSATGRVIKAPETSIFICPEEKAPRIITTWNSPPNPHSVDRVEVGGSYGLSEEGQRNPASGKIEYTPKVYSRKVDSCRRASEVFAVAENYRPLVRTDSAGWRFNRGANLDPTTGTYSNTSSLAFYFTYRSFDGAPVTFTSSMESLRIIGGRHSGMGNAMCIDTHAESYRPDKVAYDQVSWDRWKGTNKPPGGL